MSTIKDSETIDELKLKVDNLTVKLENMTNEYNNILEFSLKFILSNLKIQQDSLNDFKTEVSTILSCNEILNYRIANVKVKPNTGGLVGEISYTCAIGETYKFNWSYI